jgi:hypothetical protein
MSGTRARATRPVFPSFRLHLVGDEHVILVLEFLRGGDIPLNAMYTLVEISTNLTTSDGLNPNDITNGLRRA